MTPKAYVTVGLQFGDEAKGSIVDSLVRKYNAKYVIRYSGGHQAAHNVVLPDGTHHTFRQFGSGTFAGAKTILTEDVIVDLAGIYREGWDLIKKKQLSPFSNLFIHEDCLLTTPYHVALNRARELARGDHAHGSCGVGIGETVKYALNYQDKALRVKDVENFAVSLGKLAEIKEYCKLEVSKLLPNYAVSEIAYLFCIHEFSVASTFRNIYHILSNKNIVNSQYIQNIVNNNITVFEGSQGTLLDEHYGFHPYTTWSTVTVHNALKYLNNVPFEKIGIMRAYTTRHGAGPLPTEDKSLILEYPELHNGTGKFQGAFRVGHLDLDLLKYAIKCNDGVDSIAITHYDYIEKQKYVNVSLYYKERSVISFIPDHFGSREEQSNDLSSLSANNINYCNIPIENFLKEISYELNTSINIVSRGPTYLDKIYLNTV